MLELAVLGLLKEKSMHGYELKKRLDEQLGHFWRISYGSLYPSLKRLAADGTIEISSPQGETSRRKNVYHITPKGEEAFTDMLESGGVNIADRDQFMLRFAFSRYMQPETRKRLLEGRRGYLQERLLAMSASLKRMRDRMDEYSQELMQYGVNETEHDIRWLTDMLAAEESGRGTAKKKKTATTRERAPRRPRSSNRTPKGLVDNPAAPRTGNLPSAQGKPAGL
ncbi:MAG TPA: PadR family transcriptional regulator [Actinomycetota bacterium]|nr:PadR family transcriptional regulator [Actinomycetota bacterium]